MTDGTVLLELEETHAKDIIDIMEYTERNESVPDWKSTSAIVDILEEALESQNPRTSFDWYQEQTEETAVYPDAHIVGSDSASDDDTKVAEVDTGLLYCALGLNGEAGEVAEKIKKDLRGDNPDEPMDVGDELGDVLWYLARTCDELGYSLDAVARRNIAKLTERKLHGTLKGSGDDR